MGIGDKIKQLRELRNFTQSYMADELTLSLSGYSKIERDETDITVSRLKKIAKVLDTDLSTLLNFDPKQVFNQYNNHNANGIVQNQQILGEQSLKEIFQHMNNEILSLKNMINEIQNHEK